MKAIDMHCDTILELFKDKKNGGAANLFQNSLHLDLERMEKGDYLLQNFAMFVHLRETQEPFRFCLELIDMFYQEIEAYKDKIGVVLSYRDIERNWKEGKMSALLTVEEGAVCEGEPFLLRTLYRMGVRMMTLTWNFENCLGFSNRIIWDGERAGTCTPDIEHGLKEQGILIVEEMESLGIIPDISHLSDAGIWDVFSHTKKPFVASHSNARSVASHPRNLTDEMIKKLSERGGVMGINYAGVFLKDKNGGMSQESRIADMIRHMKHIRNIGGIQCIGLGSDFDGIVGHLELNGPDKLPRLEQAMEQEGFTTSEIEAVFYRNVLRVYKDTLG
ncbi:dipeptidase [Lachnospiraceae bacterium 62-35]